MSAADERTRTPRAGHGLALRVSHELRALESDEVVLRNVIAERVEELRRHHLCAGRQAFVAELDRSAGDRVDSCCRPRAGPDSTPKVFTTSTCQGVPVVGRIGVARTPLQLVDRHSACRVTVDIPVAVHHLAERIHGPGGNHAVGRMALAGLLSACCLRCFEHLAQRPRVDVGHGQRRGFDAQRIVRIETLALRRRRRRGRNQQDDRENFWKPHEGYHRLLKMSLNVQIIRKPSRETAKSVRLTMADRTRHAEPDAAAVVQPTDVDARA